MVALFTHYFLETDTVHARRRGKGKRCENLWFLYTTPEKPKPKEIHRDASFPSIKSFGFIIGKDASPFITICSTLCAESRD